MALHTAGGRRGPALGGRVGFTLVEVLIVVIILGVVAAISLPRIDFTTQRMDAGARNVRGTLQVAERLAITRQFDVVVLFDIAGRKIRVVEDGNNNGTVEVGERVLVKTTLEDGVNFGKPASGLGLNGVVSSPVVGANVLTINGMPAVIFRRNGAASTDLEVYLASTPNRKKDARAVVVTESTGRADWFKYTTLTWAAGSL